MAMQQQKLSFIIAGQLLSILMMSMDNTIIAIAMGTIIGKLCATHSFDVRQRDTASATVGLSSSISHTLSRAVLPAVFAHVLAVAMSRKKLEPVKGRQPAEAVSY